jgi:hypothetical protein
MKRPLSIVLADAFDRAAHDVFSAHHAAAAHGEAPPSAWIRWVSWSRGFYAGLVGDWRSLPLAERAKAAALALLVQLIPVNSSSKSSTPDR